MADASAKLWAGRSSGEIDERAAALNSSLKVDRGMVEEDIAGSIAHATMLGECGILTKEDSELLVTALGNLRDELRAGTLTIDPSCEDIHTFIEGELTSRLGDVGRRLHTARSRNDQVATDFRLAVKRLTEDLCAALRELVAALAGKASEEAETVMPGYTHLQRAQPITYGHELLAYGAMFRRDISRFEDLSRRMMAECPLGSCALAGTTYPIDRDMTARLLGFGAPCANSIDGVSDRDFALEALGALSILMTHLSRLSEEIILFCSWEFKFLELPDAYSTGSSIMPQKKNPDMAELIRGKCGRVVGDLTGLLTTLKGLPLAYNKDLQEDKEAVFDAFDTALDCVRVMTPMIAGARVLRENMRAAAARGFINATDLADWMVASRGIPFRTAYKLTGEIVSHCISSGKTLESLPLDEYRRLAPDANIDETVYEAINLDACVRRRRSYGATSPQEVRRQASALLEEGK